MAGADHGASPRKIVALAWDAPNLDMALTELLGAKPVAGQRPVWWQLGRWLAERAAAAGADAEAAVFVNVPADGIERMRPWVEAVRRAGFAVFAKPKDGDSDIDDDILTWLTQLAADAELVEVLVASGDRRAFQAPLEAYQTAGVAVAFVGFAEFSGPATGVPFIDLETVPGVFDTPLPRTRLERLPAEGALLPPLGRLGGRPPHRRSRPHHGDDSDVPVPVPALGAVRDAARADLEELLAGDFSDAYTSGVLFSRLWDRLVSRHPNLTVRLGAEKASDAFLDLADGLGLRLQRGADGIALVAPERRSRRSTL